MFYLKCLGGSSIPAKGTSADNANRIPRFQEAGAEGHQEKQEIVKRLAAAAKLDAANLGMESAEEVRARLAKSQTIAREIMGLLRLERERTLCVLHVFMDDFYSYHNRENKEILRTSVPLLPCAL